MNTFDSKSIAHYQDYTYTMFVYRENHKSFRDGCTYVKSVFDLFVGKVNERSLSFKGTFFLKSNPLCCEMGYTRSGRTLSKVIPAEK